jgi:hypothetical protein
MSRCALAWIALAAVGGACGQPRDSEPRAHDEPAPRSLPACTVERPPAGATLASRALGTEPAWIAGQAVFEYVSPSPIRDGRYRNQNDSGGTSSIGLTGDALTFELPANRSLPSASLLMFGPPAALAFRAEAEGTHHIAIAACATDRPPPRLEVQVLRGVEGANPVATAPVATLMYGQEAVRPTVQTLVSVGAEDIAPRFDRTLVVELHEGDVVALVAVGRVFDTSVPSELEVAVDVAVGRP